MAVSTINNFTEINEWAVTEPPEQTKTSLDLLKKIIITSNWPQN